MDRQGGKLFYNFISLAGCKPTLIGSDGGNPLDSNDGRFFCAQNWLGSSTIGWSVRSPMTPMSQELIRELERLIAQGQGKLARQIMEIYRQNPDHKGKCGLEISVPCGTGPKGR